jgi:hypothetical protein
MVIEQLQAVYVGQVAEAAARLRAAEQSRSEFYARRQVHEAETAILQMRKAMESIAFAAIAPHKTAYETARAEVERDFTRDYNARRIFQILERINPSFYPLALLPATQQSEPLDGRRHWHFERRTDGFLTKDDFEGFYDRLGKYLHADNPWGQDKGLNNLMQDLGGKIAAARALLGLHAAFIQTPTVRESWVIALGADGAPHVVVGRADGPFQVNPQPAAP